ncbi:MAG: DUF1232 domain-containing protein [Anaerolineae bacterium]|nr:DUF1232 domain-containing protein [Anaerolineae bacterium]
MSHLSFITRIKQKIELLKRDTYALFLAYRSPQVAWYARLAAALVVAYALSPIDLIPDFIPVLGYLDDLIIIPAGISLAVALIPPDVMQSCRERADLEFKNNSAPANWITAAVILLIWLALLGWIINKIFAWYTTLPH